jgi:hypothetical protein
MQVIAVTKNPFLKKSGAVDKAYFVDNLGGSEILSESVSRADYISLHTLLTKQTKNMIGLKGFDGSIPSLFKNVVRSWFGRRSVPPFSVFLTVVSASGGNRDLEMVGIEVDVVLLVILSS